MEALVRKCLKGQYHATLAMLRECVEICPDDLWQSGSHPRNFWRIAYHAAFYTHLYLMPNEAAFEPWKDHIVDLTDLWADANPPVREAFTQQYVLDYIDHIDTLIDPTVDILDLESSDTGFNWYKTIGKLEHQMLNVRHLGIHVGQLQELLDSRNIDFSWVSTK